MERARIVVPIVIACLVLHFHGTFGESGREQQKKHEKNLSPAEEFYPLAVGMVWEYETEGNYQNIRSGKKGVGRNIFYREVESKRSDGSFRVVENVKGKSAETLIFTRTDRGIERCGVGLDKGHALVLPCYFALEAMWRVCETVRATADDEFSELDLPGLGKMQCIRVRYERYYNKDQTTRPDWYFDGYRWFCKGVGPVLDEFRNILRPLPNGRVETMTTWETRRLKSFTNPVDRPETR